MFTLLTILHIAVCILLILVVLLQSGKGSDLGSVFGGGASQTLFGTGGSKTIMTKVTTILAVLFMFLSFVLAVVPSGKKESALQKALQNQKEEPITQQQIPSTSTQNAGQVPAAVTPTPVQPQKK